LRRLAIPTVEDRIVLEVLRAAIEPIVEPVLSPCAYAYRRGRSPRDAVDAVLTHRKRGASFVALADIRDFFDCVPLGPLMESLSALAGDAELTGVLSRVLSAHAMRPGVGLAQGSSLSPVLSNLALLPLDRRLTARGHDLVRYCDNLCIPAGSEADARAALLAIREEVRRAGLRLKDTEARVCSFEEGFVWLGFRVAEAGRRSWRASRRRAGAWRAMRSGRGCCRSSAAGSSTSTRRCRRAWRSAPTAISSGR
jgi:CRISPR-associated protein Cas1